MRHLSRLFFCLSALAALFLTSCGTMTSSSASSRNYKVVAYKPHDPSKVEVSLSLSTQNLYVTEGDRLLMAVQGNVGKPGAATPTGNFTIYNKEKHRRRQSEPDRGYPMAYWCEFAPAYGFHEGFVHPAPHTHGCVRLHREAAARLFALTSIGTKVHIANSLPEDKKWGFKVSRLDQSKDPDPPRSVMLSDSWFKDPPGPLLVEEKE
jgi:L,D-transpeptidase-like protein